jgi:hypothetical protein
MYLVMVIVLSSLVMKVNWARTAAGNVNSRNSGSSLATQTVLKRLASVFGLVMVEEEF